MKNARNVLLVVLALAGVAAFANVSGIEVLRVSGIEVLRVDTHSWGCPPGSTVHAVMDLGDGPIAVDVRYVQPETGLATVMFPMNHPNNVVELRDPSGLLIDQEWITQFDQ
jgi:hypothetical protein